MIHCPSLCVFVSANNRSNKRQLLGENQRSFVCKFAGGNVNQLINHSTLVFLPTISHFFLGQLFLVSNALYNISIYIYTFTSWLNNRNKSYFITTILICYKTHLPSCLQDDRKTRMLRRLKHYLFKSVYILALYFL